MLKLFNLDAIEFLKKLWDDSIDIIITSPPYNLKNRGGDFKMDTYHDKVENNEYLNNQIDFLNECYRVLKPRGAMFYNHKNAYEKGQLKSPWEQILKSKFKVNSEIIWNRLSCVDNNRARFSPISEKVFWLYKKETFKLKQAATNFKEIWEIKRPTPAQNLGHKATFPPALIDRILLSLDYNFYDSIIIDPYAGTGTVAQVAQYYNFKHIYLNDLNINPKIINEKYEQDFTREKLPIIKKSYKERHE